MTDDEKLELAQRMIRAWEELDWDGIVALFAEDGRLHSVMQEPLVGRQAIAERLAVLGAGATRITLHIKALGIIDGRVFMERVDDFDFKDSHGKVPVVGVLSMDDGYVTDWLEYYDRPSLLAGLGLSGDYV